MFVSVTSVVDVKPFWKNTTKNKNKKMSNNTFETILDALKGETVLVQPRVSREVSSFYCFILLSFFEFFSNRQLFMF